PGGPGAGPDRGHVLLLRRAGPAQGAIGRPRGAVLTMPVTIRVPVAWLNLTHNKRRFLLSVLGISFAVVLMLVELGFWRALLDSQTALINRVEGDLFVVSSSLTSITDLQSFPLARLDSVRGVAGVESAQPLYLRYLVWKNRNAPGGQGPDA